MAEVIALLDSAGQLDDDFLIAAASEGEIALLAHGLARRRGDRSVDRRRHVDVGPGRADHGAAADRRLQPRAGGEPDRRIGRLVSLAESGEAIEQFDHMPEPAVEVGAGLDAQRRRLSRCARPAGARQWLAPPQRRPTSTPGSTEAGGWSRPIPNWRSSSGRRGDRRAGCSHCPSSRRSRGWRSGSTSRSSGLPCWPALIRTCIAGCARFPTAMKSPGSRELERGCRPRSAVRSLCRRGRRRPRGAARGSQLVERWRTQADRACRRRWPTSSARPRDDAIGMPLTKLFRLVEDDDGEMPLINALAARGDFSGQRARSRADDRAELVISGEAELDSEGRLSGYRGKAQAEGADAPSGVGCRHRPARAPVSSSMPRSKKCCGCRSSGSSPRRSRSPGAAMAPCAATMPAMAPTSPPRRAICCRSSPQWGIRPNSAAALIDIAALAAEAVVLVEPIAESRQGHDRTGQRAPGQRVGRGACGHPDPGQSDRQCVAPFTRTQHRLAGLRVRRRLGERDRVGSGRRDRARGPQAHFRTVRARRRAAGRYRAGLGDRPPAGAVDGRRRVAGKRARQGRAVSRSACRRRRPSACRPARSRAGRGRCRAGAGGRSSVRDRRSSRSTGQPSRRSGRARTRR